VWTSMSTTSFQGPNPVVPPRLVPHFNYLTMRMPDDGPATILKPLHCPDPYKTVCLGLEGIRDSRLAAAGPES